ncbi:MAG: hypothetical protein AB1540_15765 [Bdellovibrionota bacterium]
MRTPFVERKLSPSCTASIENWNRKYIGASPWTAIRKTNQQSHSPEEIRNAVTRKDRFPYFKSEKIREIMDVDYHSASLRRFLLDSAANQLSAIAPGEGHKRMLGMRERMKTHHRDVKEDELTIIYVGEAHATDFFLTQPNPRCGFLGLPTQKDAHSFSSKKRSEDLASLYKAQKKLEALKKQYSKMKEEIAEIENLIQKQYPAQTDLPAEIAAIITKLKQKLAKVSLIIESQQVIVDLSAAAVEQSKISGAFLADTSLLELYSGYYPTPILEELLADESPAFNNYLVIQDIHGLDSTAPFDEWPSADCLRELGIKKINIVLEGMSSKEQVSLQNATKLYDPDFYPNINAFLETMKQRENSGLTVTLQGLE